MAVISTPNQSGDGGAGQVGPLPPPTRAIALFDMDDTLVGANTAALYFAERRRRGEISRRQSLRIGAAWLGYRFNAIDMARLIRQGALAAAGASEAEMITTCERIYAEQVRPLILPKARACIEEHQRRGDAVAIVTASTPYIARPLARDLQVSVIMSTELQVGGDGTFTGQLIGEPCFGVEKVARAQAFAIAHAADLAGTWFYSDSHTDLPLLQAVGHPFVVRPDLRLQWAARRCGWPILDW
ncbi:MAG: HAD-IB family hydrolase [Myxococcales bacterium]|nr:HAD-IB family hydrolase [Myxococcales bacterium]